VAATDLGHVGATRVTDFGSSRWAALRRSVLGLYAVSLVAWSAHYGIPVQRELVIAWICGALACASLGRHPRQIVLLIRDWLPLAVVLSAYDFTRGAADSLGIGAHVHPMIDFDRFLFFGTTPTQWLQAHLDAPGVIRWWNVAFTLVYTSYFIVPFAVAGVLWARDRLAFLRFGRRVVLLAFATLATYIAFPAAPPWMAAQMGLLEGVQRTSSDGWAVLGGGTAELFSEGQATVNLVAAVPSLHSALSALVAMFLWRRVRRPLRCALALYPLVMGLALIATGEHYFFDVLVGWLYAGAAMAACSGWERRRTVVHRSSRRRLPRFREVSTTVGVTSRSSLSSVPMRHTFGAIGDRGAQFATNPGRRFKDRDQLECVDEEGWVSHASGRPTIGATWDGMESR
jgi:membrane-associated phospholipid phosphatase